MKSSHRLRCTSLLLILFCISGPALAEDEATARQLLQRQIELITQLEPYTERVDLGRLHLLRKAAEGVLTRIQEKGLANMVTMQSYQNLIVMYRYSIAFFRQIKTEKTQAVIEELLQINDQIVKDRGFDDSPYTKLTASVFSQMHKLILQLIDLSSLPDPLKEKLNDLKAPIGQVIAIAEQGDRPRAFESAIALYEKVKELYPDFNAIAASDVAFDITLEIQGLNEFYAEYAQVDGSQVSEQEHK